MPRSSQALDLVDAGDAGADDDGFVVLLHGGQSGTKCTGRQPAPGSTGSAFSPHHPVIPAKHPAGRCYSIPRHAPRHLDLAFRPAARASCGRCWRTPIASTRRWGCRPMCWRRRRSPTARCCAAAAARRRASPSNGRRSPTSGSRAGISARPASSPGGRSAASGRCSISSRRAGGSKVSYALEWEPLTLIGRLFGSAARRAGGRLRSRSACSGRCLRQAASGRRCSTCRRPSCPAGARERAAALAAEIDAAPTATASASGSADIVLTGMASDLAHLKPKLLAREFGVAQRAAIEACLAARARGPADDEMGPAVHQLPRRPSSAPSALSELPRGAHCPSCNIDYDRDFERNVELAFTPAPAIRPLMAGGYLPERPDGDAACRRSSSCWRRASGARSTLDAAAGPLSPAHPASRRGRRHRACTAAPFPACA